MQCLKKGVLWPGWPDDFQKILEIPGHFKYFRVLLHFCILISQFFIKIQCRWPPYLIYDHLNMKKNPKRLLFLKNSLCVKQSRLKKHKYRCFYDTNTQSRVFYCITSSQSISYNKKNFLGVTRRLENLKNVKFGI